MKIMYNIFKKIMIASLMMVAIVSCDNEDYLIFTAVNEKEVKFQNEFLQYINYLLLLHQM